MYKYKIHNFFNTNLENNWNYLIDNSIHHTFYQNYEINKIWFNTIGSKLKNHKLLIFEFYLKDQIIAIAPLIRLENKILNKIVFIGSGLFDYQNIIFTEHNNQLFDFIFKTINSSKNVDLISLTNVPDFINPKDFIYTKYLKLNSSNNVSMAILPSSYETYFDSLKTSVRGDCRRQTRKISELGKLKYNTVLKNNQDFLEKLIFFKRKRYADTLVRDIFENENYLNFFKELVNSKIKNFVHCSTLSLDNNPISFHLGFHYNKKYYYYFPSFDQDNWGKFSPSRLHLLKIIEESIYKNTKEFDFTIGNENYKKYFINYNSKINNYLLAVSFKGKLFELINPILIMIKENLLKKTFIKSLLFKK